MESSVEAFSEWAQQNQQIVGWLVAISVATFLISTIAIPLLVIRMSPDYFTREPLPLRKHPIRLIARTLKNLAGACFLVAGLAMLLLPGQGVITVLIGISLMDFPLKRELEARLVRLRAVRRSIAWLRRKAGRPPLEVPRAPARSSRPSAKNPTE